MREKGRTIVTGRTIMIQKKEAESRDKPKAIVKENARKAIGVTKVRIYLYA